MKTLLQRVLSAKVEIEGETVGEIGRGVLVFVGIERTDNEAVLQRAADKLLAYRIFTDQDGKMNRNVIDVDGAILLVSQFTLAADTNKGLRPSFSSAAPPEQAQRQFDGLLNKIRARHPKVACGRFGANMSVSLINDGPVTFLLTM